MDDERFIRRTIALAARAKSMTSPNPMVGALVVKNGRIISEAYHKKAGTPHAEVLAIGNAPDSVRGASLYVSLEPCCHKDKRTPPCTKKIIASGIKKVVISMKDPNPKVSGKGIKELRKAGIEVISGVLEDESGRLNESYIKYITTGMPFVTLKVAMTLDGKIATPEGESKWITGEKARRMVHRLRGRVDAVMTAIGTVKADNPRLTCRTGNYKNPTRIIIDPDLEISVDSNVLLTPPDTFIVARKTAARVAGRAFSEKKKLLSERNIRIIEYEGGKADLQRLMKELGGTNITSVLVEGGSSLNSRCLEEEIVDKVMFFIAPKIIGGRESFPSVGGKTYRSLQGAHRLKDLKIKRIGEDILVEGYIRK